ncbi:MAG TPA: HDOD domain-containing protein [Burkholderiales bacterium]|nr:HDOD domain-containing protein [Burkholderiales bacterium]
MSTVLASAEPALGRFRILRELGRGAHGVVYLADDPHLQRKVAIKTLRGASDGAALLAEARIVSRLQHPNVVTLFDAIELGGRHHLVFEYVDGETLASAIRRNGPIDPARAVDIARQVLDGLAYAHAAGVIHRDVKPANIMLDASDVARVMDFGIAAHNGARILDFNAAGAGATTSGTPLYMAPERIDNRAEGAAADVFSLGVVLYEMLTGQPPATGANTFEVMHKIANLPFKPPSRINPKIDEALEHIVMKALAKDAAGRYADAAEMKRALDEYAQPVQDEGEPGGGPKKGTLEFLLMRMRHKSNFPALSQTISAINRITADDEHNVRSLSEAVLKDFALTNKLLRLVNSTTYGQFGGTISTISRAVMILGFDAVRNLAITLILFEHLQNRPQALQLKDEMINTFFGGIMTRRIAATIGMRDVEESFICGIFHNLGKLLATFYLFEETAEIGKRMRQGTTERAASTAVLGVSYEELGIGVARAWNLPEGIVGSMARLDDAKPRKPATAADKLRAVANMGDELCDATANAPPAERSRRMDAILQRYGECIGLGKKQLGELVSASIAEFLKESAHMAADAKSCKLFKTLRQVSAPETAPAGDAAPRAQTAPTPVDTVDRAIEQTFALAGADAPVPDAEATLAAGIQDITNALVDQYDLNDVLRIIVETMYRAIGFARVILFTPDARGTSMPARLAFGAGVDRLLKTFAVPLTRSQDVFQVVLDKNVDLVISDINAENIKSRIPAWFRQKISAETFLLLPIVVDKRVVGLLYADKDRAGELNLRPKQLNLLKTLRNQAVLAIRQKM